MSIKLASIVLMLGSLFFLIAAFLPYSKVFIEPDAEKRVEIILSMQRMWIAGHVMFALGSLITVIGLGMYMSGMERLHNTVLTFTGIILLAVGALLWTWHVTERIIHPEGFARGNLTPYLFLAYSLLTQAGLLIIGYVMIRSNMISWVGWMFLIGSASLFVLMVIFKDMPPFVYYLLTLVFSVALLFHSFGE